MTKIKITVGKPDLSVGLTNTPVYKAMKNVPFGVETGAFWEDGNYVVELKGKREQIAVDAAAVFVESLDTDVFAITMHNGKKTYDLMAN